MARRKKKRLLTKLLLGEKIKTKRVKSKTSKVKKISLGELLRAKKKATEERIARTKAFMKSRRNT